MYATIFLVTFSFLNYVSSDFIEIILFHRNRNNDNKKQFLYYPEETSNTIQFQKVTLIYWENFQVLSTNKSHKC